MFYYFLKQCHVIEMFPELCSEISRWRLNLEHSGFILHYSQKKPVAMNFMLIDFFSTWNFLYLKKQNKSLNITTLH